MNESRFFIDTNIFIRVLIKDEPAAFDDCITLLEKVKFGKIKAETSPLVLAEVNWVLTRIYNFSKEKVIRVVKGITNLNNLKVKDRTDMLVALELYEDYNVKFIDALIASSWEIQSQKMTVISYDRDFDKLGCERMEPSDL